MKMKYYLVITSLFMLTMFGCSKSEDEVTPQNTTDLLLRKWSFNEISVKTDAKTYVIPALSANLFGEDNIITFIKDNTYTVLEGGKSVPGGTWKLSNSDKTLTITDIDKVTTTLTVKSISSSAIELVTASVDVTKANPTLEELDLSFAAALLLYTIDKDYGGTVDFTKEPDPKTLQILVKGKAL
jgi:hypothetical protein